MAGTLIEIAKTENGVTEAVSHLRYVASGITLCGIVSPRRWADPKGDVWFPVSQDETGQFLECETCVGRIGQNRVASRPPVSTRPAAVSAAPALSPRVDAIAGLYAAACQGISAYMTGRSVVPAMLLPAIEWHVLAIEAATHGDGLTIESMSAEFARSRMIKIREAAGEIQTLVSGHISPEAATGSENASEPQRTCTVALDDLRQCLDALQPISTIRRPGDRTPLTQAETIRVILAVNMVGKIVSGYLPPEAATGSENAETAPRT